MAKFIPHIFNGEGNSKWISSSTRAENKAFARSRSTFFPSLEWHKQSVLQDWSGLKAMQIKKEFTKNMETI